MLRPGAESVNNTMKRKVLNERRASAKGWRAEQVALNGWARFNNAVALARCLSAKAAIAEVA